MARSHGKKVRAYVSTAFFCPYEGKVKPQKVETLVKSLLDLGCYEIAISDTIGKATPNMVWNLFERLLKKTPSDALAGHFHDTFGMSLANVMAPVSESWL